LRVNWKEEKQKQQDQICWKESTENEV